MNARLQVGVERIWPEAPPIRQPALARLLLRVTLLLPLAVAALFWLLLVTDWAVWVRQWTLLLPALLLRQAFAWLDLSSWLDGQRAQVRGAHGRFVTWSAALLLGPTALWLDLFGALLDLGRGGMPPPTAFSRRIWLWRRGQRLLLVLARDVLPALVGLTFFPAAAGLNWIAWIGATLVRSGVLLLLMAALWMVGQVGRAAGWFDRLPDLIQFAAAVAVFYLLQEPFAVVAAAVYRQADLTLFLLFWMAVYLLSLLAYWLHRNGRADRGRAVAWGQLEKLARALLAAPDDETDLPALLARFVPRLFPEGWVEIRLLPDKVLYAQGAGWLPAADAVWEQMVTERREPWTLPGMVEATAVGFGPEALVTPILNGSGACLGGIYLMRPFGEPLAAWQPVAAALAAQVALALTKADRFEKALASQAEAYEEEVFAQAYQAEVYAQALAYERVSQELAVAGQIQATFLPPSLPELAGWQLAVALEPARETSGDFYDIFPLADGRFGLVIADVADKGMGAALYMALSRTLIRTYASEYVQTPAQALAAVNRRILNDTSSDLFVTVFYGVLDPVAGTLTYCNAGHNPPFLHRCNGDPIALLTRTALPLGLFEDVAWEEAVAQLHPGDVLVLYTDGVVEAEDEDEAFFGDERLQAIVAANLQRSAEVIESKVVTAVYDFAGEAPQHDDITLMILVRDAGD